MNQDGVMSILIMLYVIINTVRARNDVSWAIYGRIPRDHHRHVLVTRICWKMENGNGNHCWKKIWMQAFLIGKSENVNAVTCRLKLLTLLIYV